MNEALKEAKKANDKDEVPVGAVVVRGGKIIARAHNKKEKNKRKEHYNERFSYKKWLSDLRYWSC